MQGGRDDDDVAYDEDDDDDVVADEEDDDDESCGSDDDYDINDHGQPYWAQPFLLGAPTPVHNVYLIKYIFPRN